MVNVQCAMSVGHYVLVECNQVSLVLHTTPESNK